MNKRAQLTFLSNTQNFYLNYTEVNFSHWNCDNVYCLCEFLVFLTFCQLILVELNIICEFYQFVMTIF